MRLAAIITALIALYLANRAASTIADCFDDSAGDLADGDTFPASVFNQGRN